MDTDTHSGSLTGFRTGEDIDSRMIGHLASKHNDFFRPYNHFPVVNGYFSVKQRY